MSAAEIIRELPALSDAERREVRAALVRLANMDEEIASCNESAAEGAMLLDRLEREDRNREQG